MCDGHPTRRELLTSVSAAGAALGAAAIAARSAGRSATPRLVPEPGATVVPAVTVMPGLSIMPRAAWGADLPPKAVFPTETSKFLLVHHSGASHGTTATRDVIRSIYTWHTGAEKRWADVCYHFFIGRNGDVWEGRAGSLTRPVVADATGGNQGFAQLVCLLGDFTSVLPTAAALSSLSKVFAWLAGRDLIDVTPGAMTTFVSRGSNRWPAGTVVTTPTIAAHRDMSYTTCPGDLLAARVGDVRTTSSQQFTAWRSVIRPAVRVTPPQG